LALEEFSLSRFYFHLSSFFHFSTSLVNKSLASKNSKDKTLACSSFFKEEYFFQQLQQIGLKG
jgi:hypothetical protein